MKTCSWGILGSSTPLRPPVMGNLLSNPEGRQAVLLGSAGTPNLFAEPSSRKQYLSSGPVLPLHAESAHVVKLDPWLSAHELETLER
eukprot:2778259-Pyramimonas_sp.AAC.1